MLLFALTALAVPAQTPSVTVDPRIELLSIIFKLAGNPEYNQGRVPAYNQAIDEWFAPHRDHEVVRLARQLRQTRGISYDAVMSMAIHVKDVETLAERVPFDDPASRLEKRWNAEMGRQFLAAARRFAADTRFADFLKAQAPLYEKTASDFRATVEANADLAWFGRFFGTRPGARFMVVAGLVNGPGSFGPSLKAEDGVEESYAIVGVYALDPQGNPVFPKNYTETLVHEFAHSWANPLVEKHKESLAPAGARIFPHVAAAMQRQAYGNAHTMLCESLVRAAGVRYALAHEGEAAARRAASYEQGRSFLWTRELAALLGDYEAAREKYPTLDAFMPRVAAYFNDLAGRMPEFMKAYEQSLPKLLSLTPANGGGNIDPALAQLVFTFDRPMGPGYSLTMTEKPLFPAFGKLAWNDTRTVLTAEVKLEPGRQYEFGLNFANGGGSIQSAEGVPLPYTKVRFKTRDK